MREMREEGGRGLSHALTHVQTNGLLGVKLFTSHINICTLPFRIYNEEGGGKSSYLLPPP
jgi:hypothetical protein